ncbi:MAG TPA: peptide chain release factor N(5)-glutamine methyltransferase, partial [Actinobacteria bacterium]|nr:peptide chain release factor N(5)-glutamine methyltransferase [Actinomycetota bacterium]
ERVWTVKDALEWTCEYLGRKGDDHPRRSAEWLLSSATGLSRVELYAYHDRPLSPDERARYRELVARRADGMPLQYVTGEMPFRHLVVHVEPGVFIPRPETEVLVDVALEHIAAAGRPVVVDLCTGSGCVAVAIASEHPGARVWATDINERAISTAGRNSLHANVEDRVQVLYGDLFDPLPYELAGTVDLVVSNPPYIPSGDLPGLPAEILGFEPHTALDGGQDGLDVFRRIADAADTWLAPGGGLAVELDSGRVSDAERVLEGRFEGVTVRRDLAGRERIVYARKGRSMQR